MIDFDQVREWLKAAEWRHKYGADTDYWVWDVSERFPGKSRAFFLKLEPGGRVHEHVDTCTTPTTHYCIETNDHAVMVFGGKEIRIKAGECCVVDRSIPHSSRNDGATDRIHLLIED